MIDKQQTAIFKSNQDFNKNKEKISQYIKYAENWEVASVICSYTAMACDVLLIIAMIVFLLKMHNPCSRNCAVFMSYTYINSSELHLQGVAPRSQYSDPMPEAVTLQ